MIDSIYIEEKIAQHPRVVEICQRFPKARKTYCQRYGEIFNRKSQNFRLQKRQPALILAEKFDHFVLPAPPEYGIGGQRNYYFSHMLNCIYDCRYCFLQGMYRSAHYVLFVNFEDFITDIQNIASQYPDEEVYFFSGYDCDSMALESVTQFVKLFLPVFSKLPSNKWLELRTKSIQVNPLWQEEAIPNCVVAYSFTPNNISKALENKVPPVASRIKTMVKLQEQGWKLGIRFDPVIYHENYRDSYEELFAQIFQQIDAEKLHSVSLGSFRLPKNMFQQMERLYPDEKLFANPMVEKNGLISYQEKTHLEMMDFCSQKLTNYIPKDIFFPCYE